MKISLSFLLTAAFLTNIAAAQEAKRFPAILAGHALLKAETMIKAPINAPESFNISGKYTNPNGKRMDIVGQIDGTSFLSAQGVPRKSGYKLPMNGQSIQGFSGIKTLSNGQFLVLTDNGFGSKANSHDSLLMFHTVRPDWKTGQATLLNTYFLQDPDKKIPFSITNEATKERYLTGADLDIESIQIVGETLWFGDEFGPYLIKTDLLGKVLGFYETMVDGKLVRSPDHYTVSTPAIPTANLSFTARRSRGYEGMAASRDGKFLYPLLEGPLWDVEKKEWEKIDGKETLRILEFSIAENKWTGRSWKYKLELDGNNIGDFNMIDANTALIIERDNGEGTADKACIDGKLTPDCFNTPAKFKRVYKIEMSDANANTSVRKIGFIDLMDIQDPKNEAKQGGVNGKFTFPFVTIENVDFVNQTQIIVANDNNFPFSTGREPQKQDDNEFILLDVKEFLEAK